jgi:hypothetical protein
MNSFPAHPSTILEFSLVVEMAGCGVTARKALRCAHSFPAAESVLDYCLWKRKMWLFKIADENIK